MNNSVINEVTNFLTEDTHWKDLTRLNNNWSDDPIFKNYHKLGNKQKGVLGDVRLRDEVMGI